MENNFNPGLTFTHFNIIAAQSAATQGSSDVRDITLYYTHIYTRKLPNSALGLQTLSKSWIRMDREIRMDHEKFLFFK